MRVPKVFFLSLFSFAAVAVVALLFLLGLRLNSAMLLVADSQAFQMLQTDAALNVLVVGDGTAVGTGAALPSGSIAGRIAQRYDCANIVNRARDGTRTSDAIAQIGGTAATGFDLLLLQVGADDVLRFTDLGDFRRAVADVLERATTMADHVVVMNSGGAGAPPAFVPPLNRLYERRARELRDILQAASDRAGVDYVDLSTEQVAVPLARDPSRYYASDRLHPNGDGYRLWYQALMHQSRISSMLEC